MRYLIDTNCCIYLFVGAYPALTERVLATERGEIGISTIVFAELALGSVNGKTPPMPALERLIEQMPLMPFDEAAARGYATLPFKRGRLDRLLAGHAISLDMTIITTNEADFADVPDLQIENWTVPA